MNYAYIHASSLVSVGNVAVFMPFLDSFTAEDFVSFLCIWLECVRDLQFGCKANFASQSQPRLGSMRVGLNGTLRDGACVISQSSAVTL